MALTLDLEAPEINLILSALAKLPLEVVEPVFNKVKMQTITQIKLKESENNTNDSNVE
jgi:hypothetical protein